MKFIGRKPRGFYSTCRALETLAFNYAADSNLDLVGFTYSDWVGDSIDRKFTSDYVFMFGSGPIYWSSKNQVAISLSSAEAEYRGTVNACIQTVWMQDILAEFDIGRTTSTVIFCDNHSAIKISTDLVQRQRTKHIEIHMHYIRELVHDRTIVLQYFPTDEQFADIFTKSFTEKKFSYCCSLLGVSSIIVKTLFL